MSRYIEEDKLINAFYEKLGSIKLLIRDILRNIPDDVNEDLMEFYFCASKDDYLIGQKHGYLYYAEYKEGIWVWTMERDCPWGQHIVSPIYISGEYDFPSEPVKIGLNQWTVGFLKKHSNNAKKDGAKDDCEKGL